MESSAKLVASTVETKYQAASVVGEEFSLSGNCMELANLDSNEYDSCTYTIDANGKVTITLIGKSGGKFANYKIEGGTKYSANAIYELFCSLGYTRVGNTSRDSKCVVNSYTVSFDVNGGTGTFENKSLTYNSVYGTLPVPERSGYTFYGWYTNKTGGTVVDSNTKFLLNTDQTLYARWTAKIYSVTVDAKIGAIIPTTEGWTNSSDNTTSTKDLTYDSVYGVLPTPTKDGYTFDGWYLDELYTNKVESTTTLLSTSNHVLYAKWTPNTYTISFDVNGGTGSYEDIIVTYDSTYGTLIEPSRTGYTFYGWYTEETGGTLIESTSTVNITEDTTLYARWTANTYTVTINTGTGAVIPVTEGWTNSSDNTTSSKNLTYDSVYGTLPEPTRTGYTFGGWYLDELYTNKVESTTTLLSTTSHMLYAKWTINSYTLTVDLNNGGCTGCATTGTKDYGTVVALGTPSRTGYDFTGWTITSGTATLSESNLTIGTSDVTVKAGWNIKSYTLTVDLNSGTCTGCATTGTKDYGTVVALGTPTRTGYDFTGWTITSGSGSLSNSNLTIGTSNVTVQAGWSLSGVTLTELTNKYNNGSNSEGLKKYTYNSSNQEDANGTNVVYRYVGAGRGCKYVNSESTVTIFNTNDTSCPNRYECTQTIVSTGKTYSYPNKLYTTQPTSTSSVTYSCTTLTGTFVESEVNNYIRFNNEMWRIIGVFNNQLKIVREDSLLSASWDSSDSSVNSGYGVNEWSESDVMHLLNGYYYADSRYSSSYGTCSYCLETSYGSCTNSCSFAKLTTNLDKVDTSHLWYVSPSVNSSGTYQRSAADLYYNERSGLLSNSLSCSNTNGCNDTVTRTATWTGAVGLINPCDYAYASKTAYYSNNENLRNENWLATTSYQWSMNPNLSSGNRFQVTSILALITTSQARGNNIIRPVVFLKSDVVLMGSGTYSDPYVINTY